MVVELHFVIDGTLVFIIDGCPLRFWSDNNAIYTTSQNWLSYPPRHISTEDLLQFIEILEKTEG